MYIQAFGELNFQGSYAVILLLKQKNPSGLPHDIF